MNRIVELEQKSSEILSDIEDVLHATSINMRVACSEVSQPCFATLQQQFEYTQGLLTSIKQLVKSREELFMTFLITKQIQQQETKVRRERLTQYEQKIYDQKRIIAEKEMFFESLLRPKRKRPPHQSSEQFQEIRARQRQIEQKMKTDQLVKEMIDFQSFRRMLDQQQRLKRKVELQSTKESSESQINLTLTNVDTAEFATQRFTSREQKGVKQNQMSHNRTHSAQHGLYKELSTFKKQDSQCDLDTAKVLLEQISKLSQENEEIHRIYDQQVNSYNFKKNLKAKDLKQYQNVTYQIKNARSQFVNLKRHKNWMHERVYEPTVFAKKRSDIN